MDPDVAWNISEGFTGTELSTHRGQKEGLVLVSEEQGRGGATVRASAVSFDRLIDLCE